MKKQNPLPLLMALALVLGANAAFAMSPVLREIEDGFVRLHEEVRPCVVNIQTTGAAMEMDNRMQDFFRFFGVPDGRQMPGLPEGRRSPRMPRPRATGSGFIYSAEGYIVTNNHVVEDAEDITVRLYNEHEYEAKIVGRDPDTDLAVIKIESDEALPVARLGDSDKLKVGQFAIAMGSPQGFEGSLSFGHISALGRDNLWGLAQQGLRFQNLIQTDAAINLGNSGGPLCDINGQVIGINVAILYGANSIGFAIPVNKAKEVIPELIDNGKVTRGYLGVAVEDAHGDLAEGVDLPDEHGAFVKEVKEDTPAGRAGLKYYDVIRKVNGDVVEDATGLIRLISSYTPGTIVVLEVWRDGKAIDVEVKLAEWNPEIAMAADEPDSDDLGLIVREISPDLRRRLGLTEDIQGVLVTDVAPDSPAEEANLLHGDIVMEVGREPVSSVAEYREAVEKSAKPGKSVLVRYKRGNNDPNITVLKIDEE